MNTNQILILAILGSTVAMFMWGRWRHDMVAMFALLASVVGGLIAPEQAFSGFGHPAVITVACVLVLSRGLQLTGAVDVLVRHTMPANAGTTVSLAALVGLGALLSGFMNNVGAMALLMPMALQLANRLDLPPGRVLMPLAFGTILGGMTTLIGTPPNLIVSSFRAQSGAGSFSMFDFTPIGLSVAVIGIVFLVLAWRLVPARKTQSNSDFETGSYMTELRVLEGGKAASMTLREIEVALENADAQVLGLVRREVYLSAPRPSTRVRVDDILAIEADVDALGELSSALGLKLEESVKPKKEDAEENSEKIRSNKNIKTDKEKTQDKDEEKNSEEKEDKALAQQDIVLMEFAVLPASVIAGLSAQDMRLRSRYGLNLLAVSREGSRSKSRLRTMTVQAGDLLLLQGQADALAEFGVDSGCVPLAERDLRIPNKRKAWLASAIMLFAVGSAAFGLLPAAVSFAIGVLASMALRTVPLRAVYEAIDWPVIILLAALIPVAGAMQSTGTADLIARFLLDSVAQGNAIIALTLILVVTMSLSDLMNNAATAAVMCPIAIGTAGALGVSVDSFLMAVAIGASCSFLTPIGHQNNTLILGPGGFRFGDYWRLGLPLELLVVAISVPMLLLVWPL
ncbi:Inner membrane protein YbiR [Polaromonas vacuolata]|uniref:Inner membrane protein YbiR n=1 Tax=Polaromonas vacuolata TaxID=37448 RepID=A0A6H2HAA5_9BURK|nr:SLC13 family permease [Polaromonas vacuolata]QJC56808.1 Inner membrane protein YbiR [Polaromonas vacuolata]